MSGAAETYLVVSLMMAVFAAVAAVGTSLVLGIGFERLRNGFEIVRKQTAYFSDAIRQLDEKTDNIETYAKDLGRKTEILEYKTQALAEQHNDLVQEIRRNPQNFIHTGKPSGSEYPARTSEDFLFGAGMPKEQAEGEQPSFALKSGTTPPAFSVPEAMGAHMIPMDGGKPSGLRFH